MRARFHYEQILCIFRKLLLEYNCYNVFNFYGRLENIQLEGMLVPVGFLCYEKNYQVENVKFIL